MSESGIRVLFLNKNSRKILCWLFQSHIKDKSILCYYIPIFIANNIHYLVRWKSSIIFINAQNLFISLSA